MSDENVTTPAGFDPVPAICEKLGLPPGGVAAVIALLDEGGTVPFIARYRKERTGALDEVQIRAIEETRTYVVELESRRAAILASVGEQGKLTPELEALLRAAQGKSELEDLYAPYRPRRKTRASMARERGLEPLALRIAAQPADGDPAAEAASFVAVASAGGAEGVASAEEALAGARDIVAEQIADTAEVRALVRREFAEGGELYSEVVPGKGDEPTKFEQYYKFSEAVKSIPSHRFLAIRRGEAEGVLRAHVEVDVAKVTSQIERLVKLDGGSPWAEQLRLTVADAFKRLLSPSVENDVRGELKQRSDGAAVDIFAGNLRNLLLAAPLGTASVIGVDPGLRTGCKCAAIDATGKFLGTVTVYVTSESQAAKGKEELIAFIKAHTPRAIAIGNGTGGREAEQFVKRALADAGLREGPDAPFVVQVNEAGASVYSASDLAREEFPELDLTIRGAISIARRLQDPLAELVKVEPKSIGVGQYQHDVHQSLLAKKLGDVVEDIVNHVGVELNSASAQLLGYVAGIGKSLAKKIVLHRDTNGRFTARSQLTDISGLGPKAFEQCAGFLRIAGAQHPLDTSGVHPERYPLVEQIARDHSVAVWQLIGNQELVDKIDFAKYVSDDVGEPTLRDIAGELAKPGRDPRAEFEPPKFRDDVTSVEDLKQGMVLEGIVTNVTAFGAFVDIGVHNDGLVHVSQLSEQFVKDPSEVVKVGQKLTVRVLEVDLQRKRIALSAKRGGQPRPRDPQQQRQPRGNGPQQQGQGEGQQQRGGRGRGGRGRGGGQQQGPWQGQGDQRWQGPQGQGGDQRWQGPQGQGGDQRWQGPQGQGDQRWQGQGDQQGQGDPRQGDPRQGDQRWQGQGDQHQGAQGQGDPRWQGQGEPGPGNQGDPRERRQWTDRGPEGAPEGSIEGAPSGPPIEGQAPDQRGPDQRGPDQRGPDQRGPDQQWRGPRGPRNDGGRGPRGPGGPGGPGGFGGPRNDGGQRGPRNDGGRGPRGPGGPGGGPRNDGRGPRNDGPRNDGPRNDGPRNDGPRNDGPRNDGPRNDGPRNDGPRNDRGPSDRGRGDRRPEDAPGWGVKGFTNNPFAKLNKDSKE